MTVNQHLYTETGYPEYPKITHEEAVFHQKNSSKQNNITYPDIFHHSLEVIGKK